VSILNNLPEVTDEFRTEGIISCLKTAMHHFKDAQLLCKHRRSSASYLIGLRGLEEIGKALLLNDGGHPLARPLRNHEKKFKRLFSELPSYSNLSPEGIANHARYYAGDANCPRFVDVIHQEDLMMWIHPMCKFRNEEILSMLYESIEWAIDSVFQLPELAEAFSGLDTICTKCNRFDTRNFNLAPRPCASSKNRICQRIHLRRYWWRTRKRRREYQTVITLPTE
jgi:hypothetical protein